jgi:hypothetical protein
MLEASPPNRRPSALLKELVFNGFCNIWWAQARVFQIWW